MIKMEKVFKLMKIKFLMFQIMTKVFYSLTFQAIYKLLKFIILEDGKNMNFVAHHIVRGHL